MAKFLLFLLGVLLLSCNAGYGRSLPDNSNENSVGKSVYPVIHASTEKSPNGDEHEAVKLLLDERQSGNHLHTRKRQNGEKTIADILKTANYIGNNNWIKQGDFNTALADFYSLALNNVNHMTKPYNGVTMDIYVGTRGGTTVTARSGSSTKWGTGSKPTLEIRTGSLWKKIRYDLTVG